MKLNWGYSILIVIFVFVIGMGFLVYISFQQKINLVHKDYYPLEIEHQKMIDKEDNLRNLDLKLSVKVVDENIRIGYPVYFLNGDINGEILLFRPSDYEEDKTINIEIDTTGIQLISTSSLLKGRYLLKVDWTHSGTEYYQEEQIYIR